jgi:hypothetical protein
VAKVKQLRASQDNANWWIEDQLATEITRPYKDCKHFGELLWGLLMFYRSRAILSHLLDGDADAFFADLSREALTYRTLLKANEAKLDVPKERVNASTYSPIISALATGNFDLATELDTLMPNRNSKYDGEEEFAFNNVLRCLATNDKKGLQSARDELAKVAEDEEQWAPVVQIVDGLKDQDPDAFNEGLATYLAARASLDDEEVNELAAGEEHISVEGLAFIQLAKQRNIKLRVKHPMIPPELQKAKTVIPTDGYAVWP